MWNETICLHYFSLPDCLLAARGYHAMTYDPLRERVVLFGGQAGPASPMLGDTWEWDGKQWALVDP